MVLLRDGQRSKFYAWETLFVWGIAILEIGQTPESQSVDYCQNLVNTVWQDLRMTGPAPTVDPGKGHLRRGMAYPERNIIKLPEWARFDDYILHELAHCVTHQLMSKRQQNHAWHGPEFMYVYNTIIGTYTGRTVQWLDQSAKDAGIIVGTENLFA